MPKRIENLSRRPILFLLASGDPMRLSPGAVSGSLADVEVTGDEKIDGLVARGIIVVHDQDEEAGRGGPADGQAAEGPAAESQTAEGQADT